MHPCPSLSLPLPLAPYQHPRERSDGSKLRCLLRNALGHTGGQCEALAGGQAGRKEYASGQRPRGAGRSAAAAGRRDSKVSDPTRVLFKATKYDPRHLPVTGWSVHSLFWLTLQLLYPHEPQLGNTTEKSKKGSFGCTCRRTCWVMHRTHSHARSARDLLACMPVRWDPRTANMRRICSLTLASTPLSLTHSPPHSHSLLLVPCGYGDMLQHLAGLLL